MKFRECASSLNDSFEISVALVGTVVVVVVDDVDDVVELEEVVEPSDWLLNSVVDERRSISALTPSTSPSSADDVQLMMTSGRSNTANLRRGFISLNYPTSE